MKGVNGAFFNFTYIKKYSIYRSIIKESTEWLDLHSKEKVTILVYSVIYPYLKAAIDLKYKYPNVEVCCIVWICLNILEIIHLGSVGYWARKLLIRFMH